ncbi:hypothetical protein LTR67_000182 [Exophiala xenobiotica]
MASKLLLLGNFVGLWVLWKLAEAIYNAFFHPLCKFPGPFEARLSRWWLLRQEMQGFSHQVLEELHERHGKVVRIAPNELSINAVDASAVIYGQGTKFCKTPYFYRAFETEASNLFTMTERKAHLKDKKLMSNAFSRASILNFEEVMASKVQTLMVRLGQYVEANKPLPLMNAFRCLTLDTITEFCYGEPMGALYVENFDTPLFESFDLATKAIIFFQHFPFLRQLTRWAQRYNLPGTLKGFKGMDEAAVAGVRSIKARRKSGVEARTLFHGMFLSAEENGVNLSDDHLVSEAILMNFAGTDTTAATLAFGLHNIIRRPELYHKLQDELLRMQKANAGARLTYMQLEGNELLSACLKEALRITCPVSGRLPRTVPADGWNYQGHYIPAGSIVASSPYFECYDKEVFPDPKEYRPERWLVEDTTELQKHFHPFSRGARSCIGQNLSVVEQRLAFAYFVLNFSPKSVVDPNPVFKQFNTLISQSDLNVFVNLNGP